MERGYIKIKENEHGEFVVEAKLAGGNLWLTKHEMADLFNVLVGAVDNSLRAIFKSGVLRAEDVTRIHKFEHNGKPCETTLYNLEALIFVSYRIASFEARAFRQWATKSLRERAESGQTNYPKVWFFYFNGQKIPFLPVLN